jgi:membrane-associated phospholipid phosphatase
MLSFTEFLLMFVASLAAAALAGLFFVSRSLSVRKAVTIAKKNVVFLVVLAILPAMTLTIDLLDVTVTDHVTKQMEYTDWFMEMGGGTVSALQTRLNYGIMIDTSILFYVWVFSFVTLFSPALLLLTGDERTLRRYSVAMAANYMVMIPFYILIPVGVASASPESGVLPLLYVYPNWGHLVTSIDPLNNGFPSGHTSLMVTTFLVFLLARGKYRGYSAFLGIAAGGIVLSVFLLGVHWPIDVLVGAVIAGGAAYLSGNRTGVALTERIAGIGRRLPKIRPELPAPSYSFNEPMAYPRGILTLSSYSHQFVVGRSEGLPVSLMPGSIRMNQALYIHHTNWRAETDEVRQALPDGVRAD